jgi:hypothetical protein
MRLLTAYAVLVCNHELGRVQIAASQNLVTIDSRPLLVEADPEKKAIKGCPNTGATIKPCLLTLAVTAGYSDLLRVEGRRVCLDTVRGLTDGTPPGLVQYKVSTAGQDFVEEVG